MVIIEGRNSLRRAELALVLEGSTLTLERACCTYLAEAFRWGDMTWQMWDRK
jgi:hypothetical protein